MRILDADETRSQLAGLVHFDTQRAPAGLDLTVDRIARVTGPGRLDFGGSEFAPAEREAVAPRLAAPDDDYGWWELEAGTYVARYNETLELDPGRVGAVQPLPRLLRAGASHPAFVVEGGEGDGGPLEVLLTVGDGGCALKENCRISRLLVADPG